MKANVTLLLGLALSSTLVLGPTLAYASVVTGQISAGSSAPNTNSGQGSQVSGTLSGGSVAMSTVSGTVTGGSSGGTSIDGSSGGGVDGNVLASGGGSGNGASEQTPTKTVPGSVLGASTDISNAPLSAPRPTDESLTGQGAIALGTQGSVAAEENIPLAAAATTSGIVVAWWLWLVLLVLLLGASTYTYRRYYR